MDPGRVCHLVRGGSVCWDGKLLESVPTASGWQITAIGLGRAPADFRALYSTLAQWQDQNYCVNQAISRGLRISNPGISSSVWLGQVQDSGSLSIEDLLNLFCSLGGFTWTINVDPNGGDGVLSVYPFPQGAGGVMSTLAPTRLLTSTSPIARTLGGDINTLFLRYQATADTAKAATYGTTTSTVSASITKHGPVEAYGDISSAGTETNPAVTGLGNNILAHYVRASFSGPFTVRPGELMTTGGQPVDLGSEQAGSVCQLIVSDFGYGGEVVMGPVTFLVGAYQYDDHNQVATVTPYQSLGASFSSLLSAASTRLGMRGVGGGTAAQEREQAADIRAARREAALDRRQEAGQDRRQRAAWRQRHPGARPKPPGSF
jgi:hypothetical protein